MSWSGFRLRSEFLLLGQFTKIENMENAHGDLYAKFDVMKRSRNPTAANVSELIFLDSQRHVLAQE